MCSGCNLVYCNTAKVETKWLFVSDSAEPLINTDNPLCSNSVSTFYVFCVNGFT